MVVDVGKKDTVGHPTLYATTPIFLRHFGLSSLEDLPELPEDLTEEEPVVETAQLALSDGLTGENCA
jgi:segregation and condensation protein B